MISLNWQEKKSVFIVCYKLFLLAFIPRPPTFHLFGHEIELLPRVPVIEHRERPRVPDALPSLDPERQLEFVKVSNISLPGKAKLVKQRTSSRMMQVTERLPKLIFSADPAVSGMRFRAALYLQSPLQTTTVPNLTVRAEKTKLINE